MNPLRALDDLVLPRLARGLRRCLGALSGPRPGAGGRRRLLVIAAVASVVIAVGATFYAGRSPAPVDTTTGEVVRVGAVDGTQVRAYLDQSKAELVALSTAGTAETYALVAMDAYTEPSLLGPLFSGVRAEVVYARVPLSGVQTEIVAVPATELPGAVEAGFRGVAARKDAAAKEAEWAARKLGGDDPRERDLRALYRDNARVDRVEAAAYRRLCACVYGVVVRATPLRLRQLAGRPGIRVVDAAPEVHRLDRTVFQPLRPEESTLVSPVVDNGPLPSPTR